MKSHKAMNSSWQRSSWQRGMTFFIPRGAVGEKFMIDEYKE